MNNNYLLEAGHPSSLEQQVIMAVALSHSIVGEAGENSTKIFLNRFVRKNVKGKILNDVSVNRFNVLLYQAKTARLTEDDLGVLLLIVEVFIKNMHNLIVNEELQAPLKISFANIFGLMRMCLKRISEGNNGDGSVKKILTSILNILQRVFKLQSYSAANSQDKLEAEKILSIVEKSKVCDALSASFGNSKQEDQVEYESSILVVDGSAGREAAHSSSSLLNEDLIFCEDIGSERILRNVSGFMQPGSEFLISLESCVLSLIKLNTEHGTNHQLVQLLCQLVSAKKGSDAESIAKLVKNTQNEVLLNPSTANLDLLLKVLTDNTISVHLTAYDKIFCNLIEGLGKISIESKPTTLEELLSKVQLILKNYSENMNLNNIEKDIKSASTKDQDSLGFVHNLFGNSFSFMANMSKIEEDILKADKGVAAQKAQGKKKAAANHMEVEELSSNIGIISEQSTGVIEKSDNNNKSQNVASEEDAIPEEKVELNKKPSLSAANVESLSKSSKSSKLDGAASQEASKANKHNGHKWFEETSKIVQHLYQIFRSLSETQYLAVAMTQKIDFLVIQELIAQIKQFSNRDKQISGYLTKIILVFINKHTQFTEESLAQFSSFMSNSFLGKTTESFSNEISSIYMKIYLSIAQIPAVNTINEALLQALLNDENDTEFRNYHMILLNLLCLQVNQDPSKHQKIIQEILSQAHINNRNILQVLLILYNLLVPVSSQILVNKSKAIFLDLLQGLPANSAKGNNEKQQQSGNASSKGVLSMSDAVNVNAFVTITDSSNVKTVKHSLKGVFKGISELSIQSKQQFCSLITSINSNMGVLLNRQSESVQLIYCLIMELNQIACNMCPDEFKKSTLQDEFELISRVNSFKSLSGILALFSQSIAVENSPTSGLIAVLLRVSQLAKADQEIKNKQQQQQSSSQMVVEIDESQQLSAKRVITECLKKMKQLYNETEFHRKAAIELIFGKIMNNPSRLLEKQVLLWLMKEHSWTGGNSSVESINEIEKVDGLFEKINTEINGEISLAILQLLSNRLNGAIDQAVNNLNIQLQSSTQPQYVSHLLSLVSHPLSWVRPELAKQLEAQPEMLEHINRFLLPRLALKLSPQFYLTLLAFTDGGQVENQRNITEEILLESIFQSDALYRSEQSRDSFEAFFNTDGCKFNEYFRRNSSEILQDHEKQAFIHVLSKFSKYTRQATMIKEILSTKEQLSEFVKSALSYCIQNTVTEVKQSPLNLKAFCLAFSEDCQVESACNVNLLKLCKKVLENQGKNNNNTSNLLVDLLLCYPNRQADGLLVFAGLKGINLKDQLWFPVSELAQICFASSDVELQYDLEGSQQQLQQISSKQSQNNSKSKPQSSSLLSTTAASNHIFDTIAQQKQKVLNQMKNEQTKSIKDTKKVFQALERLNNDKYLTLDADIQKVNYETNKNLFYNTEHIANFKILRQLFTKSFLLSFTAKTNPTLLHDFIHDCEISLHKITLSDSEEKNKVIKAPFLQLMRLFEVLLKESQQMADHSSGKQILCQAVDIIDTIVQQTQELIEESYLNDDFTGLSPILAYNCERIIQVAHFIFTNSIKLMQLTDLAHLVKQIFAFALSLPPLNNQTASKYSVQLLLMLVLHVRQASNLEIKNGIQVQNQGNNDTSTQIVPEQTQQQQSSVIDLQGAQLGGDNQPQIQDIPNPDKMECEKTREELIQEIDKKLNCVPKEIISSNCTLVKHNNKAEMQSFYKCHTCGIADIKYVVCAWCAYTCHNGHDLAFYKQTKGTCDCSDKGPEGQCKAKGLKKEVSNAYNVLMDSPRDPISSKPLDAIFASFENHNIPQDLVQYIMKSRVDSVRNPPEESAFKYERKQGAFQYLQEDRDDMNSEVNEQLAIFEKEEEEEKNDFDIFSQDSDAFYQIEGIYDAARNGKKDKDSIKKKKLTPEMSKKLESQEQQQQQQQQLLIAQVNQQQQALQQSALQGILSELCSSSVCGSVLSEVETQLSQIVPKWDVYSQPNTQSSTLQSNQVIDFLSSPIDYSSNKNMDNTLAKIICKLVKTQGLDMAIRDEQFPEANYYLMQGAYGQQSISPMTIRKPIDHNNQELMIVANGSRVVLIEKTKLFSKITDQLKGQISSNNLGNNNPEDGFAASAMSKIIQMPHWDIFAAQPLQLEFTVMHVRFSPKNPLLVVICGLTQMVIAKISEDNRITKISSIPQKTLGDYINKVLWLPFSEQYLVVMNLRCVKLLQVKQEGGSSVLIKFNSNESSGIFKDFLVTSHPTLPNEYVLLVACADGRVYYSEFNTQQREEITLTTYINLPTELIPKGQVCMGLSFSETSLIMSVSYKNGVNIFGRLDLKTHQLTNAFAYKPLSSHNKNGLLQFIERSGEIMANSNEIHVDESQSIHITTLRDPNNQSNYSIHSGYLTAIKLSKSSIQLQPIATSLVKPSEDRKCEGYCFVKNDKLEGVTFVVSLHDDGSMNMYGIPTDGTSAQQVQKNLLESAQPQVSGNNSSKGMQLEANPDLSEQQLDKGSVSAGSGSSTDPSLKVLINELKLTDLSKTPILQVDFAENATPLKYDRSSVVLEVNKVKQNELLFNEKNNVIISKSEPQEINLQGLSVNQVLIGVRVRMQMSSNTGQGIYKCTVLNRECKLLNCSTEDKKILDIPLSNLESIYVYLHQNSLKFTLSSFNSVSTSLKMASAHEIKIISVEPYGITTTAFQLKEKLEQLKSSLNIRSLSSVQADPVISAEQLQQTEEVLIEQLADTTAVQSVDYIARRDMLSTEVSQPDVLGLVNQLDILTLTLSTNNNNNNIPESIALNGSSNTSSSAYQFALQKSTGFSQDRIKSLITQLKVLLVRPTVNGKPSQLLLSSVKRALKASLILLSDNNELLTHPYNYTSFKMYARIEHFLTAVVDSKDNDNNLSTLSFILKLLIRLIPSKVSLLYAVFGLYPSLLGSIIDTFIGLLKGDFDQTECQVIVAQILKINIQYFKFLRDKQANNSKSNNDTKSLDVQNDPAADAFVLFERLLKGIQQSNMKQKLLDISKEYLFTLKNESNAFTSEDNVMQSSKEITFGFDVFNIDGIAIGGKHQKVIKKNKTDDNDKNQKLSKESSSNKGINDSNSKSSPADKQLPRRGLFQNSDSQSKSNQDQLRYERKGNKQSQPVEEFDHGMMYQGYDALSEEEMLKLAIEMSLQDKSDNNNNNNNNGEQEGQQQQQQQLQQPLLQQDEQHAVVPPESQAIEDEEQYQLEQQQIEQFQRLMKLPKEKKSNKNKKPHKINLEEDINNNMNAQGDGDGQPEGDDDDGDDDDDDDDNEDDNDNNNDDDEYEDLQYFEEDMDAHVREIVGDEDNRSGNDEIEDIEQYASLRKEELEQQIRFEEEEESKKQSEDTKDLLSTNKSNAMEVETNINNIQSFEQIKATTVTATIQSQDASLFVVLQLLNRLDLSHTNPHKSSIVPSWYSDDLLNVYCFMVSQLLIIQSNQQTLSASLIANMIYSLLNGMENAQLQSHSSVQAKIFIFTAQLIQTLIRVPNSEKYNNNKDQKQQQESMEANNEDCDDIHKEISNIYMSRFNNNNNSSAGIKKDEDKQSKGTSQQAEIAAEKIKNSSKKDIYKTLRELLKGQLSALETSKNISYLDRAYELVVAMLKHFEGTKSSLRIEYANGEVVEVVSRVTLKKPAGVLISECQRDMEVLAGNIQQVMQISDQVQFENTLNLVYGLVTLDSSLLPNTQEQKWTVLLSECLVSPTAQKVSSDSAEKLLQLLAKTANKYHDMRDCIQLRKNYEILIRVMKETSAFSEVSYEQLVVIDHSLKKCEEIALSRRQNWSKFCDEKQDVFGMLYDIAFKDVRGQVAISYRLLSLYYQPLVDFSKYA